jgi:hypothetical protein
MMRFIDFFNYKHSEEKRSKQLNTKKNLAKFMCVSFKVINKFF